MRASDNKYCVSVNGGGDRCVRTSTFESKRQLHIHEQRTGLVLEVLEVGVSFENLLHVVAHDADHLVVRGLCGTCG